MSSLQVRTFVLTERQPRRCRLSSLDLGLLLSRYPGRIEVIPTARKGVWRLTARGCAGVVVTPTLRLIIRPKISLDNLFFLVDPTAPVLAAADRSTAIDGTEVFEFLAGQFASRLARLAAAGLQRGYRERTGQGGLLQGRIDLAAQLRDGPACVEQLHYRYDDFTPDIPCNRALKAIAERLLISPLLPPAVQHLLRQGLTAFDQIRAELNDGTSHPALSQLLHSDYRLLLDLGRLLLDGLAPGPSAGSTPGPAFLLNMERVWERYVTRLVQGAFTGREDAEVAIQRAFNVACTADCQPLVVRPDIVIERGGKAGLVIDAKWKHPARGTPPTDDLYQVLAYATALGAPQAILVYPGRRDAVRVYHFDQTPLRVTVRRLQAQGTREAMLGSGRKFQAELLAGMDGRKALAIGP
jgi:5-methylcytosine-specific restriction enzyme subunit McrC